MNFIASALQISSLCGGTFFIVGKRHSDCFRILKDENMPYNKEYITQGFIVKDKTSYHFVNRQEGAELATKLGYQPKNPNSLCSEDLWLSGNGNNF